MSRLTETAQIAAAIVPVNLATAANAGDWVSLKGYGHVAIVVFKAAGGAGEPPTVTVEQAQDVSGTGHKALNFTRVDAKNGAALTAIGEFTKVTQAAANTYALAAGDTQALYVIEFDAAELDLANGFDCVQASIADVGAAAQVGCALYILTDARYAGETMPSALVD